MARAVLCFIGLLVALPLIALVALVFTLPITISGIAYLFGTMLTVSGLILAPRISRYYIPTISGIVILMLLASLRLLLVQNTGSTLKMLSLPQGEETTWINTVIDEQDTIVFGEMLFHWIGGDSESEHDRLTPAFESIYSQMRKEGSFSSPVVSTYFNLQRPSHFDAIIIKPETMPQFGVVFLHGYMGNVTAQCWVIAQAVKKVGAVTICPSTVWTGEWWQSQSQQILQSTFVSLREQGIHTIYLGGFSNGGFSIGRLASELKDEKGLAGLFFIDGFMNGTGVRDLGLPVLIIEGTQDERVPPAVAQSFASEVGELGTYVEIDSDHFLIMKQSLLVQNVISSWLSDQMDP